MALVDTIVREISPIADEIRATIEEGNFFPCIVELIEEPGEILITLMMRKDQIEEAVKEAVKKTVPKDNKIKVEDIGYGDNLIWFVVRPDS